MRVQPLVFWEESRRNARLQQLGLDDQAVLRNSVELAITRYVFDCTPNDPPSLAGILGWGKTTRFLRDQLLPRAWVRNNARNYATVVSPDGSVSIAVAAGDVFTGIRDESPSTRTEKGPATRDAVSRNQLSFVDLEPTFRGLVEMPGIQTWLLLHYVDDQAQEIRLELSLPASMSDEGFVSTWRERIVLTPIPLVEQTPSVIDEGDEIEVNVQRRSR